MNLETNDTNTCSILTSLSVPLVLFCFACVLWELYNWRLRDVSVRAPLPPGSFGLPIIGQTHLFLMFKTNFFDGMSRKFGSIYKTHLFGQPTIRITDACEINALLKERRQHVTNSWPRSTHALLKGGLALETSYGLHKTKRKLVLRAFCHGELSRYVPIMVDTCTQYVTRWMTTSQTVYLYPELRTLTFHVACKCLLGISPSQDDLRTFMDVFRKFTKGMFCLPVDLPGFTFHKALKARTHLLHKLDMCMQNQDTQAVAKGSLTVLNKLCNGTAYSDISSDDVKSICLELLFAGHESTSSAATTMVMNLCKHPNVRDDVHKEVTNVSGSLTYDIINGLKHVNAVVKETLRLNPPIGAGYRRVANTFLCQGYQVPKDWAIIYGIRESHENSTMTSSPTTFMPERWFSDDISKLADEFLTFGTGGRKCVGRHFAELFLKIFLCVLVERCDVRLVNDTVTIDRFPVPHPIDDLPVICEKV